jgi:hypothetical protein
MRRFNLLVDGKGSFSVDHCMRSVFQSAESKSHIPERGSFAATVAGLPCDLESLLIEVDGAAGLSQNGIGHAQVAERPTFCVTPSQSPGGGERCFEPSNAFVRMLPQVEHVATRVGIFNTEFSRRFIITDDGHDSHKIRQNSNNRETAIKRSVSCRRSPPHLITIQYVRIGN